MKTKPLAGSLADAGKQSIAFEEVTNKAALRQ
jgi:hypothetical protein